MKSQLTFIIRSVVKL